jgi:hypothetical protein
MTTPKDSTGPVLGCNFWHAGTTWECRGDGFLWDADYDGFDPEDESTPCPQCNTLVYLTSAKEEAESCAEWSVNGVHGTGESLWLNAVSIAKEANPEATHQALLQIRRVEALFPGDGPGDYKVQAYVYEATTPTEDCSAAPAP